MGTLSKTVTFIQYDIPPLKSGEYRLTARQTVNQEAPNDFRAERVFAVAGNRFQLGGDDVVSTFPPANSNGEYDGVLPHVVLRRSTLPWQRTSVTEEIDAPWLAVLLIESDKMPEIRSGTAKDVIPLGETITVSGSSVTGTGTMPPGYFSYPNINPLDYGQTPDSPCSFVDLTVAEFSQIAPTALDLPFLAHIREVDTYDSVDDTELSRQWAVVLGNRIPAANTDAYGVLVSLENMGPYLPDDSGNPSAQLPQGTTHIRLITFTNWRFFANNLDETFQNLAENLNKDSAGVLGMTTVRIDAPSTTSAAVDQAIQAEATALTADDAQAILLNGLAEGYVPMNHHLREAGDTVSWYRGPLLPYGGTTAYLPLPAFGPDALLRYDPYVGMFDTSYAGAWQLGQLLALQSSAYATALYQWKKGLAKSAARAAEQALLAAKLGGSGAFTSLVALLDAPAPDLPPVVAAFLGQLRLLAGVPFAWLVPDEAMLPTESFRLFSIDPNWVDALVDGAFSIGTATAGEREADAAQRDTVARHSARCARTGRCNHRPSLAATRVRLDDTALATVTGVLLRSQLVPGWPRLNINGYSDTAGTDEVPKLRMVQLSSDVILCLFDGIVSMVAIHEAPEQLHCGIELENGAWTTTLREVNGPDPGQQYLTDPKGGLPVAVVPIRSDGQTLQVRNAALSVQDKLNTDFDQQIVKFTSAEFALEFIKGVVKVEFVVGS